MSCALDEYERDSKSTWCKETETAKHMAQRFKVQVSTLYSKETMFQISQMQDAPLT